ncbi:hypothetical protein HDV03_003337 [Kappamyces sp. JEL0829]|nr:hypothetical protein HDV03_003337 [Kappamyces sp. JEL0829]
MSTATPAKPAAGVNGWSEHAELYEQHFTPLLALFARDMLTLAATTIQSRASTRPLHIQDIACGTGAMTLELLRQYPSASITASDFSQGMLDILQDKLMAERNLTQGDAAGKRVRLVLVDGQTLAGQDDNSFDLVTSSFGITLFPNIKRDIADGWFAAYRVLKKGGVIVASAWKKDCPYTLYLDHFAQARSKTPFVNPHATKDGFERLVQKAGFCSLAFYEVSHEFVFSRGQDFMDGLLDNPYFRQAVTQLGREAIYQMSGSYFKKASTADFLSSPVHFTATALICIARKPRS